MKKILLLFLAITFSCTATFAQHKRYLYYLHGKIVEDMGRKAATPAYGKYELDSILDCFKQAGFEVTCDLRPSNTDPEAYSTKLAAEINKLISSGVAPADITVVGASKGGIIAMLTCAKLHNEQMNFVFLACCNESISSMYPPILFYGNILSIHEKSDDIGLSCASFKDKSGSHIKHYKEIELNTGRKHGFLYKPLPEWMKAAGKWGKGDYN